MLVEPRKSNWDGVSPLLPRGDFGRESGEDSRVRASETARLEDVDGVCSAEAEPELVLPTGPGCVGLRRTKLSRVPKHNEGASERAFLGDISSSTRPSPIVCFRFKFDNLEVLSSRL